MRKIVEECFMDDLKLAEKTYNLAFEKRDLQIMREMTHRISIISLKLAALRDGENVKYEY